MSERDALFTFYVTVIAIDVNVISKAMQSLVSRKKRVGDGDVNKSTCSELTSFSLCFSSGPQTLIQSVISTYTTQIAP